MKRFSPSERLQQVRRDFSSYSPLKKTRTIQSLRDIPLDYFRQRGYEVWKLALLGGYTTDFIALEIQTQLFEQGVWVATMETPYGAFESAILSRDSTLEEFKPDFCYLCVSRENICGDTAEKEITRWLGLWQVLQEWLQIPILQNTFDLPPTRLFGSFDCKRTEGPRKFLRQINEGLGRSALRDVHLIDVEYLCQLYGQIHWRDDRLYHISKVPVAEQFWHRMASEVVRTLNAIRGRSKKCLVLDLDNTLWGGAVGDVGCGGIEIGSGSAAGEDFFAFQRYVKQLKDRGVILAVCSKNELEVAQGPFLKRQEMLLRLEDFASFQANWLPKDENLRTIAKELEIGLESLVFVDDNPVERDWVKKAASEVAVIELPEEVSQYALAVSESGYFDRVSFTSEDSQRAEQYSRNRILKKEAAKAPSYEAYLKGLEHRALIAAFDDLHLERITQLINKTNQFNLTTRRYTLSEVRQLMSDPDIFTRYLKLQDRFGDSGLVSIFIGRLSGAVCEIDSWLMSCRVLKRCIERHFFKEISLQLIRCGVNRIVGHYLPTAKNGLVKDLFGSLGFEQVSEGALGSRWELGLEDSSKVSQIQQWDCFVETVAAA